MNKQEQVPLTVQYHYNTSVNQSPGGIIIGIVKLVLALAVLAYILTILYGATVRAKNTYDREWVMAENELQVAKELWNKVCNKEVVANAGRLITKQCTKASHIMNIDVSEAARNKVWEDHVNWMLRDSFFGKFINGYLESWTTIALMYTGITFTIFIAIFSVLKSSCFGLFSSAKSLFDRTSGLLPTTSSNKKSC
jgi:hypothetical protein